MSHESEFSLHIRFLRFSVFRAAGHSNFPRLAESIGCSRSALHKWLNGKQGMSLGSVRLISNYIFSKGARPVFSEKSNSGGRSTLLVNEGKFVDAIDFLKLCDAGTANLTNNPPEFVRKFLQQIEDPPILPEAQRADAHQEPLESKSRTFNEAPDLVELSGVGWTQMSPDSRDFELAMELTFGIFREVIGHREFRYGAKSLDFKISLKNFLFTKIYRNSRGETPEYVRYEKDGRWYVEGPTDRFGLLRGNAIADVICVVRRIEELDAQLELSTRVRRVDLEVASIDVRTNVREEISTNRRIQLIDRLVCVLLNKRNDLDEGGMILSTAEVVVEDGG